MAENSFRPYKGKWLMKDYVMKADSVIVEKGDLMELTDSDAPTVNLATDNADAIVGIAAHGLTAAQTASTIDLKVLVPAEPKAEMIGKITIANSGGAVVGTDIQRMCDVENHEGVDLDTKTHGHFFVVRIIKACSIESGSTPCGTAATAGEGIFIIANIPQTMDATGWTRA